MSYYRQGPYRSGTLGIGVPGLTSCVKYLIIACGGVWIVQLVLLRGFGINLAESLGTVPAWVVRGALWQPLTYMFLHSPENPFHLVFNMLMLWMFGGELERFWGSRSFLRYYLVCGAGAGLGATLLGLLTGQVFTPTIGASGALFGLFVAYGIIFAERTIVFMLIFPMKAKTMAWIMVALNFLYLVSQPVNSGVSYVAHLAGALVGFLYLKRVWNLGVLYRDVRWKLKRRKFRVMPPNDREDRWIH